MHRRASLPDFEAHEQQHAKPKFATAGRRESGYQADQKRRTSQQAGEADANRLATVVQSIRVSQAPMLAPV
jgi:hypothetical protein